MIDIYDVDNVTVFESLLKAQAVLARYNKICVSVSGGSDSDIVMDIVEKLKGDAEVSYVWFNTGLEYQATKDHLKYLEEKYGVTIQRVKAIKPIPLCVYKYGVPFISKNVSEMIWRLQRWGFKWEDKPYEELIKEYPNCRCAIEWWCNKHKMSMFKIGYNKYLKEFMIANPPTFKIAPKCCLYAKKKVAKNFMKQNDAGLNVYGVRRSEGGIRATSYKNCYSQKDNETDEFRPIFYYKDEDKRYYEEKFGIVHSDCYTKYGLVRTGCVGCPYGRNVLEELAIIEKHEPKLYKACINVFGQSYEYTKKYREFCASKRAEEKADKDQFSIAEIYYNFTG